MRFTQSSNPGFFHQGALSAWLRTILGSPKDFSDSMTSDALEQGHRRFTAGEAYRFTVFGIGDRGREYLAQLPEAIMTHHDGWDDAMPFRDHWQLEAIEHWPSGEAVSDDGIPLALDWESLEKEMGFWRQQQRIRLRVQTPLTMTRSDQKGLKGMLRYCRDTAHVLQEVRPLDAQTVARARGMGIEAIARLKETGGDTAIALELGLDPAYFQQQSQLWFVRVDDALRSLAERCTNRPLIRTSFPRIATDADMFWVNASYRNERGEIQPMGGLLGEIDVHEPPSLPDEALALLVIGQYLGIGQRRVFGNGRYQLIGDGEVCTFHRHATTGWLERAMREENLELAWHTMVDVPDDDESNGFPDSECDADASHGWDRDNILSRAGKLLRGEYQPPALHGFIHEDADGGLRPLAAPPISDRVMQRALHQAITPALDLLMDTCSYGYRSGRSRYQVRDLIQSLYREGYRWVFESDIRSFFDTVSWDKLRIRLHSLLADPPAVDAIMAWMQAPVQYKGARIERARGLPQGSPLSPVLANLMLDDFDHDLTDAGCKLIRFADDFVIVAKMKEIAEHGGRLAEQALVDAGLTLNREKTRTTSFSEGFRFLGFIFVDGLAVACAPKRSEDAGKPPPQSWLAMAAIADEDDERKREQKLRGNEPVALSLYEDRGQVLIFCGEPAVLFTRGGRARIEREDECLLESPWGNLDGIVMFGRHHITTPAMLEALAHDVPIHLASGSGHYQGMIFNPRCASSGKLWLAQQQLFSREESALQAARSVVDARIRHMRETLRRRKSVKSEKACQSMEISLREVIPVKTREQLNGVEGNATRNYFEALRELVPEAYGFHGRNKRPPKDPFNALLSLGYTQLYAHVDSLLRADGLLPEKGFYHQARSGHAALASDLMEPFRHVVERCALSMVQRERLKPDDFTMTGEQGCRMTVTARRVYLASLSEALLAPVRVSGGGQPLAILDHIHRQSLAVKMWIAGKSQGFQAWRMR